MLIDAFLTQERVLWEKIIEKWSYSRRRVFSISFFVDFAKHNQVLQLVAGDLKEMIETSSLFKQNMTQQEEV